LFAEKHRERLQVFVAEPFGHRLHKRVIPLAFLVCLHDRQERFDRPAGDRRNALGFAL
jgi:hypothetical protein